MEILEAGVIPPMPSLDSAVIGTGHRPFHLSCSPDGTRVVYGTSTSVIGRNLPDCFSLESKIVEAVTGNKTPLLIARVSPTNDLIAGGDNDGGVYVWQLSSPGGKLKPAGSCSSPGMTTSPSTTTTTPTSTTWTHTGEVKKFSLDMKYVLLSDIAFSSDGRHMCVVGVDRYSKKLGAVLFAEAGNQVGSISGHTKGIFSCHFCPAEDPSNRKTHKNLIATAGKDGLVCLHQGLPYKPLASMEGHQNEVYCVRFSPDGKRLASCGADGKIILWDFEEQYKMIKEIKISEEPLLSFHWSPDSNRILIVGSNLKALIVSLPEGEIIDEVSLNVRSAPIGVAWSSAEWAVVAMDNCTIEGIRTGNQMSRFITQETFSWSGIRGGCSCIATNTISGRICVGDSTGSLLFLSSRDGEPRPVRALKFPSRSTIKSAVIGKKICAVVSNDGVLRVFSVPSMSAVRSPVISPSKKELADQKGTDTAGGAEANEADAGGANGEGCTKALVRAMSNLPVEGEDFDVAAMCEIKEDTPTAIYKLADEGAFLVACSNGTLFSYPFNVSAKDAENLQPLWKLQVNGKIRGVSASIDGSLVAIAIIAHPNYPIERFGDENRTELGTSVNLVEMYEVDQLTADGFRFVCVYELTQHEITAIAVSPSGTHLAIADTSRDIIVTEIETGKIIVQDDWRIHSTKINDLDWSPDGTKVASGSQDKDAIINDITYKNRQIHIADAQNGGVTRVQFLFNNVLLSTGGDGTLRVFEIAFGPPPPGAEPYVFNPDEEEE